MSQSNVRNYLKTVAFWGAAILAVPTLSGAYFNPGTRIISSLFLGFLFVWARFQMADYAEWRLKLVQSNLGMSEKELADAGIRKQFIDEVLVDDRLRAEFVLIVKSRDLEMMQVLKALTGEAFEKYLAEMVRDHGNISAN